MKLDLLLLLPLILYKLLKNSTAFFPAMKDLFLCRFVYLELPAAAKTPCTRFRWWQPVFSGEDYDQWAVDDIIILSEKQKQVIPVVNPTLPQVGLPHAGTVDQRKNDWLPQEPSVRQGIRWCGSS